MSFARFSIAIALVLGACGDDLYHPNAMPTVEYHGGKILHHVHLVTVTYPGDPLEAPFRALDDFLPDSHWLAEVGDSYDIHGGSHVGSYTVTHPARAMMTDDEILADLEATVPLPPDATIDGDPPIYLIYVPHSTTVTGWYGTSCIDYAGFHRSTKEGRIFVIMADCDGDAHITGELSGHEVIEAATDPTGHGWYADAPYGSGNPWRHHNLEVADLCDHIEAGIPEAGYILPRVWSVGAASASHPNPCVPVPDGDVWVDVDLDPTTVILVGRGESTDVTLTGWSSGPTDDWPLQIVIPAWSVQPIVTLSSPTINDGRQVTMHIEIPADVESDEGEIQVWSRDALALIPLNPGIDMSWGAADQRAVSPPSTTISAPVTNFDSSLAR